MTPLLSSACHLQARTLALRLALGLALGLGWSPAGAAGWTLPAAPVISPPRAAPDSGAGLLHVATFQSLQQPPVSASVRTALLGPVNPTANIPAIPGGAPPAAPARILPAPATTTAPTTAPTAAPETRPSVEVLGAAQHYLMPGQEISLQVILRGRASELRRLTHQVQPGGILTYALRVTRPTPGASGAAPANQTPASQTPAGQTLGSDAGPALQPLIDRLSPAGEQPIEAELTITAQLGASGEGSRVALRFAGTRIDLGFAPRRGVESQSAGACLQAEGCARPDTTAKGTQSVLLGARVATLTCGARPESASPWDMVLRVPVPRQVNVDQLGLWLPDPDVSVRYSSDGGVVWSEEPVLLGDDQPGGALSRWLLIGMDYPATDRPGSTPCAALSGLIERQPGAQTRTLLRRDSLIGADPGVHR